MKPRMDDIKTLTYELASAILQCEAECVGTQPQTSVRIAELILAEVLPSSLTLGEVGSSGNVLLQ
ncbi:MAG TPA: hypothetical protein VK335_16130 [Bryobacteraceae bacterium]|nr:hypothetical protein [Bryobacteraceae bacterium]